ncbi:3-hydroxyacyl-ACP dehydratase FabZ [Ligilactobacillus faecis]|uniref:3-hydroxyacyl-ACP dehydratase FabZ n=1 Tax=Ligilactobacillus faecis TaxID=762833 RepID=UPI00246924F9|nr:3-hydroxyacyl-ACP dehydratase FabZ [Ligilactobacillus faecis]WGN90588.1 3-hydroxyacyl-ACP dehydratase FabZ [Ligilactobacillus faecis]
MDAQTIMELIPNRYPLCYIDYVEELVVGEKVIAVKNVTINEPFFQGHFPKNPVMPGVLIIETLAQAASIMILKDPAFQGKTAYLGAIHNARFRKIVRPGDVLRLEVTLTKQKENMGLVDAKAFVGTKKVCTAELMFIVGNGENRI